MRSPSRCAFPRAPWPLSAMRPLARAAHKPAARASAPALALATTLATTLAITAGAAQAQAQGQGQAAASAADSADSAVVITGTRIAVTSAGLAQQVTVIDRQALQQMGAARLEDVLARLTGVYVDQAGGTGSFASMYMRGAENSHLLVLLDGVKLNDPTTTRGSAYDLSSLDVAQIERIEVLRGPASAVYGGEALAGVLHIITRRAAQSGLSGSGYVGAGGDGHRRIGGQFAFGTPALQGEVSAGRTEEGSASRDARLRVNTVKGSLRFQPLPGMDTTVFATEVQRESAAFADDSGGPRLAVIRDKTARDSRDRIVGARAEGGFAGEWRAQLALSMFDRRESANNAAVDAGVRFPVPAFTSDTDFQRGNVAATVRWEPAGRGLSLVAGVEHQTEEGTLTSIGDFFGAGSPQTLTFALERDTSSVFAEAQWKLTPAIGLQLGVRNDKVQGIKAVTTPHLGLVWEVRPGSTLKFAANEGFKPPSFFALGFAIGGNPNLQPERSRNAEASFAQRLDAAGSTAQVTVFETRYRDLVDFDGNTFTNVNRGTIVVRGVEPELTARMLPGWRITAGATLLSIDERDGLQPLRNRPEKTAHLSVQGDLGRFGGVFAGLRASGGFLDRSNPTGDTSMPGFHVLDAAYTLAFGAWRGKVAVDNVLDKQYEQFVGFPAQGRRVRAEVSARF